MARNVETLFGVTEVGIARRLAKALEGRDLDEDDLVALFSVTGRNLLALLAVADTVRQQTVGEVVTYVVNRNISFTNVCVKRCSFCAFSRTHGSDEGYLLPIEEIVRRAREARDYGATEVCIQAGLPPAMQGDFYIRICRAIREAVHELHIHAFSPEEIVYGCRQSGLSVKEYLAELRGAGIGSLPGTSAEILDDEVRRRLSPGRISTEQWTEVITTAHALGIRTTSTIMYGHVETPRHCARHLLLLRSIQRRSGGFTEFVPLSFVHTEAPAYHDHRVTGIRAGATGIEVLRMHAVARLALNRDIPNIQVSWVKEGMKLAQACLAGGANDLGGTLMNESISTTAGARHGQLVRPRELRRIIVDAGRMPAERSTLYSILRRYEHPENGDSREPLDRLKDEQAARFGSYEELTQLRQFRFSDRGADGSGAAK